MYDINTKVITKGKKFFTIFFLFGILFLIIFAAILIGNINKVNSMDGSVMSHSVNLKYNDEGMGMAIYSYEVSGREYTCSSGTYSNPPPSTENKMVYYQKSNPGDCAVKTSINLILIILLIIPIIFIGIAVYNFIKINKRVKMVEELNTKGKLVKNLPYTLEYTGMSVNNRQIQRPVVDYTLPSGSIIKLYGDPRHDNKSCDADGYVDLVIDESNPDNYFIDFEINRILGNKQEDYFISSDQIINIQMTSTQQQMYNQQPFNNQSQEMQNYNQSVQNNNYNQNTQ